MSAHVCECDWVSVCVRACVRTCVCVSLYVWCVFAPVGMDVRMSVFACLREVEFEF